jgi:hypothetical protein
MTESLRSGELEARAATGPVAAVFERGESGESVLREAAELAGAGREVSVLTLAPQSRSPLWGRASGTGPYNEAVLEEAAIELDEAREILGSVAGRASFEVLSGSPQPHLASWVTEHRVALVVLPHHRLAPGGNLYARSLRKKTSAEVRLVKPARRSQ